MSDTSQGPGWWQAADGKWYSPEQAPGGQPSGPPPGAGAAPAAAGGSPAAMAAAQGPLAEWPQRAGGALIDFVALGILANIVGLVIGILGTLLSVVALVFAFYNAYLNGATGRSVGKRLVGLKVVGEQTGQPIGGLLGIVRHLAHIIDSLICFVGWLFPLWDAKKQTIADKIMKTVVLDGQPKQEFGPDIFKP